MALLDLLGRRWALRVIWELRGDTALNDTALNDTASTFRELQARCGGVSSSVLADRLRELSEAGIIGHSEGGYALTAQGATLLARLAALDEWAATWQPPGRPPEEPDASGGR